MLFGLCIAAFMAAGTQYRMCLLLEVVLLLLPPRACAGSSGISSGLLADPSLTMLAWRSLSNFQQATVPLATTECCL